MVSLNIDSIGIIGAGPGGLASLYEFLHTNKDGTSTVGTGKRAETPAFSKIVAFEQKDHAGGIWAPATPDADLPIPPQEILNTGKFNDPAIIRPRNEPPQEINGATKETPIVVAVPKSKSKTNDNLQNELEWKRSGVYPYLSTNIPSRFTRFSYLPDEEKYHDKSRPIYPFLYHQELSQRFTDFVNNENLHEFIRLNTTVEDVYKNEDTGKWIISVRHKNPITGANEWYQEEFDAIVVANGHYTIPSIPAFPGLAEFNANYPDVLIHAKSVRELDEFKDKDVLFVGGSISTANIIQYIIPVAKSVTISKRSKNLVFDYINRALVTPEIDQRGEIVKFDPKTGKVHFVANDYGNGGEPKKFDKIILTTGYHYHYPFLSKYFEVVNPSHLSRVKGLYYHTFNQQDPTIGATGILVSHLNFHTIEASAAALAGVWSGAKELPTLKEQQEWENQEVETKGDSLFFHFLDHHNAQEHFVDKLYQFAPKNRYNPLEKEGPLVGEVDEGVDKLEKLFYDIKDKKLGIDDVSLPSLEKLSIESKA
ncbi:hypothetical protein MG5_03030 [Candida albicans P57072]|uniref:Thiol-specific monooxygenase n=3 Tax=Candida albicans TaxID=5476 RepID=A0A1D8PKB7_CANAL|nr:uncharacterized protein CAALFM_C305840WA [Candida albicans SC5314]EEQ44619.1 conserved hypothetical protein [Candida albicans WO-1]KGQ88195.1 hypothetical protein MEO_03003 [Candida albicans P94015]KGQ92499.1 hypothetical protein MEU_03032 [Candida albicans P37005]KGQ98070.1 hypothetical protein MG1_03051 [Candida albicans GC75]KGR09223.1 hypothetical protein MG5_03037 [Candida albicans P57072]KGR11142.1 hypothetical protein MG3_03060 [Candida albicans P78048]KGR17691.1 hypothetical prote|eukprot:XP_716605.1 hypothetical protein CAALFM_C305840WA [Candida albicans SC5314]